MLAVLGGFAAGCLLLVLPWPLEVVQTRWLSPCSLLLGSAVAGALSRRLWMTLSGLQPIDHKPQAWVLKLVAGMLLGFGWSAWQHLQALNARLTLSPGGNPLTFEAEVVGQPVNLTALSGRGPVIRLRVRVTGVPQTRRPLGEVPTLRPGTTLRLTWNQAPAVREGDRWRLLATVNGPWGYANPGGFDFERWLFGQGIQGTGYIRAGQRVHAAKATSISRAREALAIFLAELALDNGQILLALLTGSRSGISSGQWDLFRRTGTVHLMVVSGLHVGLAGAAGYLSGQALIRLLGCAVPWLLLWLDARKAGALFGGLCCTAYLLLSGTGVPAQRAWLMALPLMLLVACGRRARPGSLLILALAFVLLLNPLQVHLQGFWLSFAAVALLMLAFNGQQQARSWTRELVRSQCVVGFGLAPLLVGLTGMFSLTSFPANLLAVPVVSFGVVPLVLFAGLLAGPVPDVAAGLLGLADWLIGVLLSWLSWLADAPVLHLSGGLWKLLAAQGAVVSLILGGPRCAWPLLSLGALLCLPTPAERIPPAQLRVVALDVGQGTSVLIDTENHRLLFDAGPAYPGGFETGSAVVVPSLVRTGAPALDALILSHDDLDHVGGAAFVRRNLTVHTVYSSFPGTNAVECHGRRWRWDGVDFAILRIPRPAGAADNDRSCVLLVSAGDHRLLLAGDISATVESRLLRLLGDPITLMFAPHHGSGSSSSRSLVRVARPRIVFVSAALGNRYGHPHPEVMSRYARIGARVYQTGRRGALSWRSDSPETVLGWRDESAPYWRSQEPAPAGVTAASKR